MSKSKSTVVIWSNYQDDPKFYWILEDLQHLNGMYINMGDRSEWQPLLDAAYGHEGTDPFKWRGLEVPIGGLKYAVTSADYVIHCGEVP